MHLITELRSMWGQNGWNCQCGQRGNGSVCLDYFYRNEQGCGRLEHATNRTYVTAWLFHPTAAEGKYSVRLPENSYQNRPSSYNKARLSTLKTAQVIKFSHHNGIKLEANNKDPWKITKYLGTLLLNNYGSRENTKRNPMHFELSGNQRRKRVGVN